MPLDISWPDAELESIAVNYDKVDIALSWSTGRRLLVTASGHVGLSLMGFWDEMIVETAELL